MKVLCIAIGNSLRGDDGVAHRIAERLVTGAESKVCSVFQLTPEVALDVASAKTVIFIDADVDAVEVSIDPLVSSGLFGAPMAHRMEPREIVWLAERLYGFAGQAYLCRLPVESFEGDALSEVAEAGVGAAEKLLRELVR